MAKQQEYEGQLFKFVFATEDEQESWVALIGKVVVSILTFLVDLIKPLLELQKLSKTLAFAFIFLDVVYDIYSEGKLASAFTFEENNICDDCGKPPSGKRDEVDLMNETCGRKRICHERGKVKDGVKVCRRGHVMKDHSMHRCNSVFRCTGKFGGEAVVRPAEVRNFFESLAPKPKHFVYFLILLNTFVLEYHLSQLAIFGFVLCSATMSELFLTKAERKRAFNFNYWINEAADIIAEYPVESAIVTLAIPGLIALFV
uniref:Uncharacterized protein n=1 Tax=Aplanochytrium stocchinoi TaxID=215587 RepID=A0A7S3PS88_9STRA|mmetsp:Transcript_1020/g.1297  ORF Transcript_1020/g.1297 Transcript_1020/m.1297 type:complete len:258 (+) Transcript_1020:228-1001(+)